MSLKAKGYFVENPRVFVVCDQALLHRAVLITNIEPDPVSSISYKLTAFQNGVAAQHQLIPARLPTPVEPFDIVILDQALGDKQPVSSVGSKPYLAVVPECTATNELVLALKRGPARVHRFENAVLHHVMRPGKYNRSVLGHV